MRAVLVGLIGCGCTGEATGDPSVPLPQPAHPPSQVADAAAPAPSPACQPLTVEVPKLAIRTKLDGALPAIVDFGSGLDAFYAKLATLGRRAPTLLRIGVYGDSNLANDRTLGAVRRQLQPRFGDGGHGWVSFGKPWGWYQHMDIEHGTTGAWTTYNLSNHRAPDNFYGFAGTAAESTTKGATAWVATAGSSQSAHKQAAPVGTAVASFDLHYLARPNGGTFEIAIDGIPRGRIDTSAAKPTLQFAHFDVSDGPHKLVATVVEGRVRLFGIALERAAGIVIDSIGVGSLNPWLLGTTDGTMASAGITRRNYDVIIETTGSNMCASRYIPPLIARWREALPQVAIMLWSPPDAIAKSGESDPLMRVCASEKRAVAKTAQIAFWDLYAALGGYGSMPRWLAASPSGGWAEPDGIHLGPGLNKYIAERFVHVVVDELAHRSERTTTLGCVR